MGERVLLVCGGEKTPSAGGREHAMLRKVLQSDIVDDVCITATNAGIAKDAALHDVCVKPLAGADIEGIARLANAFKPTLVLPGPELPLLRGLADRLNALGYPVFGPSAEAAQMTEGSKVAAKELMIEFGIPTITPYRICYSRPMAMGVAASIGFPVVIKRPGPAQGKGVARCFNPDQADQFLRNTFVQGDLCVIIEPCKDLAEASLHAFCDGITSKAMPITRDHKWHNDKVTGGMMAWGPVDLPSSNTLDDLFVGRMVSAFAERSVPYVGVMYPGLMVEIVDGVTHGRALEYNARFGDPEAQVLLSLLKDGLVAIGLDCVNGRLASREIQWEKGYTVCRVLASGGYPDCTWNPEPIEGLEKVAEIEGVEIIHAGTTLDGTRVMASGGRVLNVVAKAPTLQEAWDRSDQAAQLITFYGKQMVPNTGVPSNP